MADKDDSDVIPTHTDEADVPTQQQLMNKPAQSGTGKTAKTAK